jgi:hypothetical protein
MFVVEQDARCGTRRGVENMRGIVQGLRYLFDRDEGAANQLIAR